MRIISGKHKGKTIHAPEQLPVRPTTDIAKEGLFNVLSGMLDWEQTEALDMFAGTGNISYELVSRGVKRLEAVDRNSACIRFIDQQLKKLNFSEYKLFRTDIFIAIPRFKQQFDLIFCDPPYDFEHYERLANEIFKNNLLKSQGVLVIEHPRTVNFENHPFFIMHRKYGKVNFSFFTLQDQNQ